MLIAGRISEAVKMSEMMREWEQKKSNLGKMQKNILTPEEQQINMFKEQLEQSREASEYAGIDAKIKAGKELSPEEIEYLRRKNPEMLKKYEEMQMEKEAYERELRNCETKEEVEQLKMQKLNGYLSQMKKISGSPYISEAQEMAMMGEILARVLNLEEAHVEFTKTAQYARMPDKEEADIEPIDKAESVQTEDVQTEDAERKETDTETNVETEQEDVSFEQVKNELNDYFKKKEPVTKEIDVFV